MILIRWDHLLVPRRSKGKCDSGNEHPHFEMRIRTLYRTKSFYTIIPPGWMEKFVNGTDKSSGGFACLSENFPNQIKVE